MRVGMKKKKSPVICSPFIYVPCFGSFTTLKTLVNTGVILYRFLTPARQPHRFCYILRFEIADRCIAQSRNLKSAPYLKHAAVASRILIIPSFYSTKMRHSLCSERTAKRYVEYPSFISVSPHIIINRSAKRKMQACFRSGICIVNRKIHTVIMPCNGHCGRFLRRPFGKGVDNAVSPVCPPPLKAHRNRRIYPPTEHFLYRRHCVFRFLPHTLLYFRRFRKNSRKLFVTPSFCKSRNNQYTF